MNYYRFPIVRWNLFFCDKNRAAGKIQYVEINKIIYTRMDGVWIIKNT